MAHSWMDLPTAPKFVRQVHVFGTGHLATATRLELIRLGLQRESGGDLPQLLPPLVITCTDVENDPSVAAVATRALNDGSPLLFACLAFPAIRIGPLVEPFAANPDRIRHPPETEDTSYMPGARSTDADETRAIAEPGLLTGICARVGGLIVAAQALSFLQGARKQCVLDTLVELYPLSIESKAYRVLKVRQ